MKAVHFGAGNIGRGFVGWLLHDGGYEVVFSDVAATLVEALQQADSYTVHEVGPGGTDHVVTNFTAVNSAQDPDGLADEIASADVVTTAVGPTILKFVAGSILSGLRRRPDSAAPVQVMACENAIGATDVLMKAMADEAGDEWAVLAPKAVFANTAVDRIVPGQPAGAGLDVTVEPFYEWAIERAPFGENLPNIPGAHFVDDLAPYIERKLYTVNTGHAATAYLGYLNGAVTIADALQNTNTRQTVERALEETSGFLHAVHGLDEGELATYRETILRRFENPLLPDTVNRVGRQPLRKLSRQERFVGPASAAADRGLPVDGLLQAMAAAVRFDDAEDEQAVELQGLLASGADPATIAVQVTGLSPEDALYPAVVEVFSQRMAELS